MQNLSRAESSLGLRVRRIQVPSGEVAYIDEGEGPPVLLLHGAPFSALGFVRVIRALRTHYRVIAPDLPGFGRSRAAPAFDHTLAAYARSIEEIIRALGLERLVVFGCDASGCTALAAAARLPAKIAGLVIADTVPIPLTGRAWLVKMVLRHVVSSRLFRWLNRKLNLLPWLVVTVDPLRRPFTREERAELLGQFEAPEQRDRIIDLFSAMGRDDAFMQQTAAAAARSLADKPALLLFGQLDPVRFAGAVSRFRAIFRRSTVRIIPREKHFPILAAGAEVASAIAQWQRTLAATTPPRGSAIQAAPGEARSA